MKEIRLSGSGLTRDAASFLACLATILERPEGEIPTPSGHGDPSEDHNVLAWLGSLQVGLVPVAQPNDFAWSGPWIARARDADGDRRSVVMYGRRPSGVVWDPIGDGVVPPNAIEDGFVVAAEDIARGMPRRDEPAVSTGRVEQIWVAGDSDEPGRTLERARAFPGKGLAGDRYAAGRGTFPSRRPGSALTLIEAEVCDTFHPPLTPEEHRRNVVTRGIGLNGMVGVEFTIGSVCCRGIRLCEPCATMQRYAHRAVLRPLVHQGGLRADILEPGEIQLGDAVVPLGHPGSST